MVPILAKESVIIKSANDTAILLGNYEIAYAIGVMLNILGQPLPGSYETMAELMQYTLGALDGYAPQNHNEENIIRMMKDCKVLDDMDEQVQELLQTGLQEKQFWTMPK